MKTITAGYTAFNGHVFTQAEADAYNHACQDTAKAERAAQYWPASTLAAKAADHARDRQNRLFKSIIGE